MSRIAFDLDRAPIDRRHDDATAVSGERQRGREFQLVARYHPLGHPYIRNDRLNRLAAGGKARRNAAGQQIEGLPPVERTGRPCE